MKNSKLININIADNVNFAMGEVCVYGLRASAYTDKANSALTANARDNRDLLHRKSKPRLLS